MKDQILMGREDLETRKWWICGGFAAFIMNACSNDYIKYYGCEADEQHR